MSPVHACPHCGIELTPGARGCRDCGARIDSGAVLLPLCVRDEFETWREAGAAPPDPERG